MCDKLRLSNYGCWNPLPSVEANIGPPGLPRCRRVLHAMVLDPGAQTKPGRYGSARVDFRELEHVAHSQLLFRGSFPSALRATGPRLSAYGLQACGPTHKVGDYSPPSKGSLPGGWPSLTGAGFPPARQRGLARPRPNFSLSWRGIRLRGGHQARWRGQDKLKFELRTRHGERS